MNELKPMLYPLDIQLFAEPAPTDPKTVTDPVPPDPESTPKTFTQKDIDDAVSKGKALAKAKYEKQLKTVTGDDVPPVDPTKVDPAAAQKETQLMQKYAQAEIKVALNASGVDPVKVQRASALIPFNEILSETGDVDTEKLNKAVTALLKEWPELKKASDENRGGFKIGSNQTKDKGAGLTIQEQVELSMGLKKK